MDYTTSNYTKLFDELLKILGRHHEEPGVAMAHHSLQAARFNYTQRSIDHMMLNILLAIHDLIAHGPNPQLHNELRSLIAGFAHDILNAGARLSELSREYEARGGKLLSAEEILKEVDERRGTVR